MNGFDMLLVLQGFRESGGAFLLEFFKKMTYLGEMTTVRAFLAIIYWCIWKELGTYLLIGWSGIRLASGALKVTFCKYRPWIQDPRITPDPSALPTATGYSFPSGHSTNAACVYGQTMIYKGIPWLLRIKAPLWLLRSRFVRRCLRHTRIRQIPVCLQRPLRGLRHNGYLPTVPVSSPTFRGQRWFL